MSKKISEEDVTLYIGGEKREGVDLVPLRIVYGSAESFTVPVFTAIKEFVQIPWKAVLFGWKNCRRKITYFDTVTYDFVDGKFVKQKQVKN